MDRTTVEALKDPSAWPHPAGNVELIETHASWVFLAGEFAYKIKKPVDFGFLDFSTLGKRRHCCREEVRLNRRLAPDLYLDVVPIAGAPPRIGGEGEPLEYAVRMRRFDTECGFDRMALRGALKAGHIDATAVVLAVFHDATERADPNSGFGTPEEVIEQALQNFEPIGPRIDAQAPGSRTHFDETAEWTRAAGDALRNVFASRLADGFVRDCHGDLHLRNIVWWREQVVPFDRIEFNPSLRWIDVMSELAFLLMDLDDHGLPGLSRRLLNGYLELSGDVGGLKVSRFYQAYRAMVRAKVESLRRAQLDRPDPSVTTAFEGYLELAAGYTQPLQPRLLITHGLSGSGKTYVSQQLLQAAPLVRLRSDVERKRLFGLSPLETSDSTQDAGIYSEAASRQTFDRLAQLASSLLEDGWPVLVDATFLQRQVRDQFRNLAEACGVPFAIMHCAAGPAVLRQRVAGREGDASEADIQVLERQFERVQPLEDDELAVTIRVDTSGEPDLEGLLDFLE